jgi:biopolymer transport protein ExbD
MRRRREAALSAALLVVAGACASTTPPAVESVPIVVPVSSVPPIASSAQPAISYELPRAAQWTEVQIVFAVELRANGELRVDGKPCADEQLEARAREALSKAPELRAVVRADAAVTYGRVVHVMDLLNQAGITRIAFAVSAAGR